MEEEYTVDLCKNGNKEDFISEQELKLLDTLKSFDPKITADYDDKMLMVYLFSSQKDPRKAFDLILTNRQWRSKHGVKFWNKPPSVSELNPDLVNTHFFFVSPGKIDKEGRGIVYIFSSRMNMKRFKIDEHRLHLVYLFHHLINSYHISVHRRGMLYVHESSGLSWHNSDLGKAREILFSLQGIFPTRVPKILVVNPGRLIRLLSSIGRYLVRKKLFDRISVTDTPRMLEYVERENLIRFYGGMIPDPWTEDRRQWLPAELWPRLEASCPSSSPCQNHVETEQEERKEGKEEEKEEGKEEGKEVGAGGGGEAAVSATEKKEKEETGGQTEPKFSQPESERGLPQVSN